MPITFFLQSTRKPAPIYCRIREGITVDAKARTKFSVNPEDWSKAKGSPKVKDAAGKMLQSELDNFKRDLTDRLNKRQPHEVINSDWLKLFINPPQQAQPLPGNLVSYFDKYIEAKQADATQGKITVSTIKKARVNRQLLSRMQDEAGTPLLIEDVSPDFAKRFETYCIENNYAPNTTARALMYIKTVCKDARERGLQTHPKLDSITTRIQKGKHIYLTFDELELIERAAMPNDHLDNARDWLIISCYTAQRVSDFLRFNKSMIRMESGKQLIDFIQVKTKKPTTLPLHPKVIRLLNKRGGDFPRSISDQRYNDYIKEVSKIAGLTYKVDGSRKNPVTKRKETGTFEKWELVTSHIGRRSFATNFFGIIPTSLIISATNHSTERQLLEYIGKTDTTKAMQLADYF